MSDTLIIQFFLNAFLVTTILTASIIFTKDFIRNNCDFKIKEQILKIAYASIINFSAISLRIVLEYLEIRNNTICFLFMLEVFFDLLIFISFFKLFYFVRTEKTGFQNAQKRVMGILADLFVWIGITALVSFAITSGENATEIILNLRLYYILPYSFLIFSVFLIIPSSIKAFKEIKYSFLFLSVAFFLEFVLNFFNLEIQTLYELLFSIKFFCFMSIVFNFYRITLLEPSSEALPEEIGCTDEE